MISKGGNLNTINELGQTPAALGSESLMSLLKLNDTFVNFGGGNNSLLKRGYKDGLRLSYSDLGKVAISSRNEGNL